MKRLFQTVSAFVVGSLLMQPAFAGVCTAVERCGMMAERMGPDCPMDTSLPAANCSSDCCHPSLPTASLSWSIAAEPIARVASPLFASAVSAVGSGTVPAGPRRAPDILSSPPRYILLRVFRI
jgi:hypothetical protein